jgi:hypothetical protein
MFYWIYDLPTWTTAFLFGAVFVAFSWLGAIFIRPLLRLLLRKQEGINDVVGYILSLYSVMYGLLVGMLAIVTFQGLSNADAVVSNEAAALAALYRDVSSYPDPTGAQLRLLLKHYTEHVIGEDWPLQQKGIIPTTGTERLNGIRVRLFAFEPQTKGQEAVHAETLHQFNEFVAIRRTRLNTVEGGVPGIMWYTVIAGAVICIVLIWMFNTTLMAQLILGGIASFAIASMICVVALMDNPFRGEIAVSPAAFQMVYDALMRKSE